ncbi:hypothetical protein RZS08_20720, partial [Arthrospira platensis SPKY1]|nr:hypothetical protein [Arthrospira platensis SPKY1]
MWEAPHEDLLSNTWMWNNWGGVTALDGLIINMRSTESNTLTAFPWILPEMGGTFSPLFTAVADVNQSNSVTALDALTAMQRVSGQSEQFPSGRHNFLVAGTPTQSMQAGIFPASAATIFANHGSYDPAAPATAHYYEATTATMQVGTNYMQLYFVAAGDMNASYLPGTQLKQTIDLHYEG